MPSVGIREFENTGVIPRNGTIPGNLCFPVLLGGEQSLPVPSSAPHICSRSVQEKHSVLFLSDALPFPEGNKSYAQLQPQLGFSFNAVFLMLHILSAQHILVQLMSKKVMFYYSFFSVKRKNKKM